MRELYSGTFTSLNGLGEIALSGPGDQIIYEVEDFVTLKGEKDTRKVRFLNWRRNYRAMQKLSPTPVNVELTLQPDDDRDPIIDIKSQPRTGLIVLHQGDEPLEGTLTVPSAETFISDLETLRYVNTTEGKLFINYQFTRAYGECIPVDKVATRVRGPKSMVIVDSYAIYTPTGTLIVPDEKKLESRFEDKKLYPLSLVAQEIGIDLKQLKQVMEPFRTTRIDKRWGYTGKDIKNRLLQRHDQAMNHSSKLVKICIGKEIKNIPYERQILNKIKEQIRIINLMVPNGGHLEKLILKESARVVEITVPHQFYEQFTTSRGRSETEKLFNILHLSHLL
jgi:hypothetical protein